MYGKNDLVLYDCYMKELADSLNANKSGFVTVHVEEKTTKCTLDYVIKLNG